MSYDVAVRLIDSCGPLSCWVESTDTFFVANNGAFKGRRQWAAAPYWLRIFFNKPLFPYKRRIVVVCDSAFVFSPSLSKISGSFTNFFLRSFVEFFGFFLLRNFSFVTIRSVYCSRCVGVFDVFFCSSFHCHITSRNRHERMSVTHLDADAS